MSATRIGLIDAVLADPDEDTLRLVFADFLTDHSATLAGSEVRAHLDRAELIRVQCQRARLSADDPGQPELAAREARLLEANGSAWAERLGHPVVGYHRGLAQLGELTPPALQQLPQALFDREPVELDLDLRSERFGYDDLVAALPDVDALAASPRLRCVRRITTLESRSMRHGDAGYFARLMRSPYLGNLTSLTLFELIVGLDGIRALAESPSKFRLHDLKLYGAFVDSEDEDLEETGEVVEAFTALIRSEKLSRLRSLELSFNGLGVGSVRALAGENALPQGMSLEIAEVNLGPGSSGVRPLIQILNDRFRFGGLH